MSSKALHALSMSTRSHAEDTQRFPFLTGPHRVVLQVVEVESICEGQERHIWPQQIASNGLNLVELLGQHHRCCQGCCTDTTLSISGANPLQQYRGISSIFSKNSIVRGIAKSPPMLSICASLKSFLLKKICSRGNSTFRPSLDMFTESYRT